MGAKLERQERTERRGKQNEERIQKKEISMIVKEKEYVEGYREVKILRNNATKDDKKVIGKNVPPIELLKLKKDILLTNPFHCLINQTEKKIRQEKNIKIIPSSDTVL